MFRPCIDLHEGRVKQIVGGTLRDTGERPATNFVSERSAGWFAEKYRQDGIAGGHVIKLGAGNEEAAREALGVFPNGLQIGGGINEENAEAWLEAGASHVIITSWVFKEGCVDWERLKRLRMRVGRDRLVVDLSCRVRDSRYFVVTDRWQNFSEVTVDAESLIRFAEYCDEFLVHAADVEGLCRGIDERLVELLAEHAPIPVTYAGGAKSMDDLRRVEAIGQGRVDLTIGSALDIFGGAGVRYDDAVAFNRSREAQGNS
jgi:phosphoribosylformimino-5-aminoimidazole carboxamide ribotide isomerase